MSFRHVSIEHMFNPQCSSEDMSFCERGDRRGFACRTRHAPQRFAAGVACSTHWFLEVELIRGFVLCCLIPNFRIL